MNNIIFKKAIPRRTFLRGVGATLALPLLDGMFPAFARAGDAPKTATRLGFVYFPNGAIMDKWKPAVQGSAFEFPPILAPLSPFRESVLVLGGLDSKPALAIPHVDVAGEHPRASGAFLTGIHVNSTS